MNDKFKNQNEQLLKFAGLTSPLASPTAECPRSLVDVALDN